MQVGVIGVAQKVIYPVKYPYLVLTVDWLDIKFSQNMI